MNNTNSTLQENDFVLQKAYKIIEEKQRESICVQAGICPVCGEKLIPDPDDDFEDEFWLVVCSKDKNHYSGYNR